MGSQAAGQQLQHRPSSHPPACPPIPSSQIPLVTEIRETSDEGRPIVATQPDSVPAKAYVSVAERVWQQLRERDAARAAGGPRIVVE